MVPMPTSVGIRRECNGQLQWSAPPILDVWCVISPQRKLARHWRDKQSAHVQSIWLMQRCTCVCVEPKITKNGTRRLTCGMGARGMRCCVHTRATRSRTLNYLERLHVKSPRTSPRVYVILLIPCCTMQLSSVWYMYCTITWIYDVRSAPNS